MPGPLVPVAEVLPPLAVVKIMICNSPKAVGSVTEGCPFGPSQMSFRFSS